MKRILAMLLAIILILSCCPNVFATEAAGENGNQLDSAIVEVLDSQISQEERDMLVSRDPSLLGKVLLRVDVSCGLFSQMGKRQTNEIIDKMHEKWAEE